MARHTILCCDWMVCFSLSLFNDSLAQDLHGRLSERCLWCTYPEQTRFLYEGCGFASNVQEFTPPPICTGDFTSIVLCLSGSWLRGPSLRRQCN
ncbi:hypothetical protein B0T22DRAFT_212380 [Podospora appendiculata]|uniref:Secreted protein n=1 Tax=Podospora appendiculata TaxID=314037 RepID=A0AAE0X4S2_9PEZI|nr:hypothetical protein B0T22DRAFT_212380 [Podospora appendiculata]